MNKNQKAFECLKEVFQITAGPWDSVVISEELFNRMKNIVEEKETTKPAIPLQEGVAYATKSTGELFKVTRVSKNENTVWGIYENNQHLGECPIDQERLVRK